ncbi:anaphase-promoting complex subunit 2 [Silurus asotus]|uniref:Anaphase-promoting complex subunit 2 n=1 Tax=Silurus asotus TaxID=30991 RepID=A0AAD5FH27_SILAS|nr:anaphase-promoting complex subunit 2 [Silurus asotus]
MTENSVLMLKSLPAAWDTVTAALVSPSTPPVPDEAVSEALTLLCTKGLGQYVEGWLLETLQVSLVSDVAPEFWRGLQKPDGESQEQDRAKALLEVFRTLLRRLQPFLCGLERLGSWQDEGRAGLVGPGAHGLRERAFSTIRAILLFSPPPVLQQRVLEFYSRTFSVYMSQIGEQVEPEEVAAESDANGACTGCAAAPKVCWCQDALQQLQEFSHILSRLQLLERVSSEAVTNILHRLIEQRMEQRCRGEYERSFLSDFNDWLEQVLGWLSRVFASEVGEASTSSLLTDGKLDYVGCTILQRWRCHMQQFFCRIYVNMRIEELFSIIRDFPESTPAVEDLKFCLERTNQRQQLLTSLKSAFETRLLHPGVHTSDIITVYISAIKALRELDPSMVILQVACQPIRKYLRTREDTVRQIVASLTGDTEGCSELASELSRADPVTLETQDSEDEGSDPEEWTPDPTDALTDKTGSKRRSSDIISLLDVADSRRINTNIHEEEARLPEEEQPPVPLSAMILSSEFWPQLKEEKLELPSAISKSMETYTHRFEKLKAMRTLSWKPHLGSVTLDIELEDRTLTNLSVSPIHAAIILHFQDKGTWALDELSGALGVPQELLRRKLALWQQHGVIQEESTGRYSILEKASSRERPDQGIMLIDSDEEGDSNTTTQLEQREEKLQVGGVTTNLHGKASNVNHLYNCSGIRSFASNANAKCDSFYSLSTFVCSVSVVLGLHSGHADQSGEHDPGEDSFHATHVRGSRARGHRDGRQRAAGFPTEKSARSPADRLSRSLQTAQNYSVDMNRQNAAGWVFFFFFFLP